MRDRRVIHSRDSGILLRVPRCHALLPLLLTLAACAGGASRPPPATPAPPHPIDDIAATLLTRAHVPGLAVAVVQRGEVIHARGYGQAQLEWPSPVTARTPFQIASATKVFTGTLLMQLVESGAIELDARVRTYLPDLPAAWSELTVRQLAAHAGGFTDHLDSRVTAVAPAYAAVITLPQAYAPGTEVRYGTGDFVVLAQLLETVTQQTFEQLFDARIAAPLGFTCTRLEHEREDGQARVSDIIPGRAAVYRWADRQQRTARFHYPAYTYASGGAVSCLDDLVRWAIAMDRHTLISAASERALATMFRTPTGDGGFGVVFALGTLRGHPTYGHSGGPALADILVVPAARLAVIVLTNQQTLVANLAERIAGEYLQVPAPPPAVADAAPALTTALRSLAEQTRTGTVASPALDPDLVTALNRFGPLQLATVPGLTAFTFVGATPTKRSYYATYGAIPVRWTFTLDADQRVVDLDATFE